MINTKLPRCTYDGDRGEHAYALTLGEGKVTIWCARCGGVLCKDEDPANVEVNGAAVTEARLSYDKNMVFVA